jgi:DNA repair protein SbcD/Mre11
VAEGCDAVLVAGDIFEGPLPTPEHYEAFARPLRGFPLPVVAILGNGRHDAAMRTTTALQVLEAPELRIVTRPEVVHVAGASVCCLPWAPVSRLVAARGGGDRDEVHLDAVEHLLAVARGLRDAAEANHVGPTVLLLHWSISGAALPNGLPVDLAREPILPVEELEALGFEAIVAGHIHRHQILFEEPLIAYVGSPMPLDFSEGSYEHGCLLLEVS